MMMIRKLRRMMWLVVRMLPVVGMSLLLHLMMLGKGCWSSNLELMMVVLLERRAVMLQVRCCWNRVPIVGANVSLFHNQLFLERCRSSWLAAAGLLARP